MTHLEEIKCLNPSISDYDCAMELRRQLTDAGVIEIFNDLRDDIETEDYKSEEYNYYWLAAKLIEMEDAPENYDGLHYPSHGWINDDMWPVLGEITRQMNRLKGVHAGSMILYDRGTCYNTKGYISITFDTIEDFNHFLWAGCYRYMPLSKSTKWMLRPDLGDPDYNSKEIKMELHYCNTECDKYEIEDDIRRFANCVSDYAEDEKNGFNI